MTGKATITVLERPRIFTIKTDDLCVLIGREFGIDMREAELMPLAEDCDCYLHAFERDVLRIRLPGTSRVVAVEGGE
jgi:hypothetical protein